VIITPFDARLDLILVQATVWSVHGKSMPLGIAVDTGSSDALVISDVTDQRRRDDGGRRPCRAGRPAVPPAVSGACA
jgi:hypothetical protein